MRSIDLVVAAPHVLTMEGEGVGYRADSALAVDRGRIVALGPTEEILGAYAPERLIRRPRTLLMPGFVDAHCHMELSVLRGLAQDTGHWMMYGLNPFKGSVSPRDRLWGFRLGVLEALAAGTTTLGNYDDLMHQEAALVEEMGLRGNLTQLVREMPERVYAPGELYRFDEGYGRRDLENLLDLFNRWDGRGDGRIRILFGPMGPDFLGEALLGEVREQALRRGTRVHLHVAQGDRETEQMLLRYGKRTIPWLQERGYLDEHLIAVHLTDATEEETRLVARSGASMVLCSNSIGIIDGVVPPARTFLEAGGVVGLGSDQAPGNNNHNMFNEMKLTALFHKIRHQDPEAMPAWKVLRMATVEGARAVGLGDRVGSLEEGKRGDFILVDLQAPTMMPLFVRPMRNLVPNLVYAARGNEVCLVAVDGRVLYEDGAFLTLDAEEVREEVLRLADPIGEASEETFRSVRGTNFRFMEEGKL